MRRIDTRVRLFRHCFRRFRQKTACEFHILFLIRWKYRPIFELRQNKAVYYRFDRQSKCLPGSLGVLERWLLQRSFRSTCIGSKSAHVNEPIDPAKREPACSFQFNRRNFVSVVWDCAFSIYLQLSNCICAWRAPQVSNAKGRIMCL